MSRDIIGEIAEMDLSDPQKAFDGWTDSGSIQRGCGYLGQVKELAVDEGSLYGAVDGTSRYITKVWYENGEFGSVCTCPVGSRCKHSVALMLRAKELIAKGGTIPDSVDGEWKAAIESRWVEVEGQIKEQERRTAARRLEKRRKEEAEERAAASERRREEKFREDFAAVREALLEACVGSSSGRIKETLRTFLEWADDCELPLHPDLSDEVTATVDSTTDKAFESLEGLGFSPVDMIVLAYELSSPSGYSDVGRRFEDLHSSPSGIYAARSVWSEVATRFQEKMDSMPEDEYTPNDSLSSPWYWNDALRVAWERAGEVEKAVAVSMKNVAKVGNWKDVAVFLLKNRMYDKAADIARAGIRAGWESEGCGSDLVLELQLPLSEALSGQGDHVKAAAVLAELFFAEPSVALFQRTLEESERAGCRAEVERAVIHALETGSHPDSIATWKFKPMVQEFEWKPVPKPVVYHIPLTSQTAPAWPLPWANEGVKLFDSRWLDFRGNCQRDMLFLLKLAVARGDKAEIARRFDNLPEFPNNGGFPLEGSMITLCEGVMDAMKGYRDNIVTQLSRLRKSCYVREVKDGRVYAIRTVKKLGEASDDTFVNWQEAVGLERECQARLNGQAVRTMKH